MRTRMYERDAALTAVRRLLDAAYTGHGGMVFVVAAAGLGKTSVQDASVRERGRVGSVQPLALVGSYCRAGVD